MAVNSEESVNWKVTQGDTFSMEIEYLDELDDPIDISDFTILMEIRDKPGGKILSASCTLGDGITLSDPTNGIFYVTISPEKTKKFNYPRASYQIQGTSDSNEKITFLQGWFIVNAGVID